MNELMHLVNNCRHYCLNCFSSTAFILMCYSENSTKPHTKTEFINIDLHQAFAGFDSENMSFCWIYLFYIIPNVLF